jgi:hypothetical protein
MCQSARNSRNWLPMALALVVLSMMLPHLFHPAAAYAQGWLDFLRGLTLGGAFGIEFMVLRACKSARGAS